MGIRGGGWTVGGGARTERLNNCDDAVEWCDNNRSQRRRSCWSKGPNKRHRARKSAQCVGGLGRERERRSGLFMNGGLMGGWVVGVDIIVEVWPIYFMGSTGCR